ncbi:MAG: imidazole glycerol phosphate synthase subunit HisH [Gammaproteobacteria bacterium]|nr:imidazole glycerol phosphate synthase subunit HisH [Gammaproteobacteria bacterium]
MSFIAVIDYGMGNLRSVVKALEYVSEGRAQVTVTGDPDAVQASERIVFPGQGAAGNCMHFLRQNGLDEALREAAASKPFLGLCMGMQALVDFSEENGGTECMGLLPGRVSYFVDTFASSEPTPRLKVPHMGWNQVAQTRAHPLWRGIADNSRFYFVHSYYVVPEDAELTAGVTEYGIPFASVIARDNIFAMQCHPEKSASAGLALLGNFVRWNGTA